MPIRLLFFSVCLLVGTKRHLGHLVCFLSKLCDVYGKGDEPKIIYVPFPFVNWGYYWFWSFKISISRAVVGCGHNIFVQWGL